jgi:2-oxoglutarate dehydrogenase E2 component (dihydrolipoamide succinyltransferase)
LHRQPSLTYGKGKQTSCFSKKLKLGNSRLYKANKSHYNAKQRAAKLSGNNFGEVQLLPFQVLRAQPRSVVVRHYSTSSVQNIKLKLGIDSVTSGTVSEIKYKVGDFVKMDEPVVLFETDKVTVEVKAPIDGFIESINVSKDEVVPEDNLVFSIKAGTQDAKPQASEPKKEAPKKEAAPEVKQTKSESPAPKSADKPAPKPAVDRPAPIPEIKSSGRSETREKMKPIRIRIAERLKESQNTAAMLTTFQEIDMNEITDLRNRLKDEFFERHAVKLGFMSAFVKASSVALQKFPLVNCVIDSVTNEIIHRNYHDISVAVSTPKGLVVPVLRNVQDMTFANIEKSINSLAVAARDNKLSIEDMTGGTFTISNGGVYGSLFGTPIINPPQSAILGMHGVTKRAVVVGNEIKIRPVMFVALTYDHRIIDGRDAVLFLKTIKHCIEDPNRILLDL